MAQCCWEQAALSLEPCPCSVIHLPLSMAIHGSSSMPFKPRLSAVPE
jgi:hypothetical protein